MSDSFIEDIELFKTRKIKAKDIFAIYQIDKKVAYSFVSEYHYLKNARFFCIFAIGLFYKKTNVLIGVATYSYPQGNVALKGWFGLNNTTDNIFELSRLCLYPILNNTNATSYLLGNSIKLLKQVGCRAVISLADSSKHVGSIYQVCNFKYYGLTDEKCDFYDKNGLKNKRGKVKNKEGVWLPRTRKHRYAYIIDKNLRVLYKEQSYPKKDELNNKPSCCNGTKKVYDNRFHKYYTCPICTGVLREIKNNMSVDDAIQQEDRILQLKLF